MNSLSEGSCGACPWFAPDPNDGDEKNGGGYCHYNPPVVFLVPSPHRLTGNEMGPELQTVYPYVGRNDIPCSKVFDLPKGGE